MQKMLRLWQSVESHSNNKMYIQRCVKSNYRLCVNIQLTNLLTKTNAYD